MPSLINLEQVLATFVTGMLLAKFGRKTLLQAGIVGEAISCLLVAIGFMLKKTIDADDSSVDEALILIGLFLFMGVFGLSLGPIPWLYIP